MKFFDLFGFGTAYKPEPVVEKPEKLEPEPDLSTKPPDRVVFVFGWACAKKHVSEPFTDCLENLGNETRLCSKCGDMPLKKALVKRVQTAAWTKSPYDIFCSNSAHRWTYYWSNFTNELVHFLDDKKPRPRRKKK